MKDWYANLEPRERLIVAVGAAAVAVILFWAGLWMPLDKGHRNVEQSVANWQRSLADLRVIAASMDVGTSTSAQARISTDESPVVIVDRTLRERGLNNTVKRQQPTPNGVRVEFEDVAFDQLVVWLGDLNTRYAMDVQAGSLSLTGRAGPGRINASLTLERTL